MHRFNDIFELFSWCGIRTDPVSAPVFKDQHYFAALDAEIVITLGTN